MQEGRNTISSQWLCGAIPTFLGVLYGGLLIWQQGMSVSNISMVCLMILFSALCGFFLWLWHVEQMNQLRDYHQKKNRDALNKVMAYSTELERMLLMVTPKIVEQVLTARELTEQEISVLIRRFTEMLNELEQIIHFVNQASKSQGSQNVASLRKNAEKIRDEIDVVLEALQFQDRVSQILNLAEDNLTTLRKTIEKIQMQGSERNPNLIKVEAMLAIIQTNYESVNHLIKRSMSDHVADELTFF